MKITSGKVIRPQKVVIYGSEGIGKTSMAARFPNPLFIDTEGGTAQLDVRRIEKPSSFAELISVVKEVAANPTLCKTLILDTADWAELSCIVDLCAKYKKAASRTSATEKAIPTWQKSTPGCWKPWIWLSTQVSMWLSPLTLRCVSLSSPMRWVRMTVGR